IRRPLPNLATIATSPGAGRLWFGNCCHGSANRLEEWAGDQRDESSERLVRAEVQRQVKVKDKSSEREVVSPLGVKLTPAERRYRAGVGHPTPRRRGSNVIPLRSDVAEGVPGES